MLVYCVLYIYADWWFFGKMLSFIKKKVCRILWRAYGTIEMAIRALRVQDVQLHVVCLGCGEVSRRSSDRHNLAPVRNGGVGHKRERMRDFIAGLFPDLQAHDLRTIMVLRNHKHYWMIKTETKASRYSLNTTGMLLIFYLALIVTVYQGRRKLFMSGPV